MGKRLRDEDRPGLYCIELRTADWNRSIQWYRESLGLRVLVRVMEDGYALLKAGETRIALLARDAPGEATRRISLAFEVNDLDAIVARLRAFGSAVTTPAHDAEGLREANTTDPDGNRIRLFSWPTDR